MIKVAMKATKGKKSEAANLLGWGRNTLARKMNELFVLHPLVTHTHTHPTLASHEAATECRRKNRTIK